MTTNPPAEVEAALRPCAALVEKYLVENANTFCPSDALSRPGRLRYWAEYHDDRLIPPEEALTKPRAIEFFRGFLMGHRNLSEHTVHNYAGHILGFWKWANPETRKGIGWSAIAAFVPRSKGDAKRSDLPKPHSKVNVGDAIAMLSAQMQSMWTQMATLTLPKVERIDYGKIAETVGKAAPATVATVAAIDYAKLADEVAKRLPKASAQASDDMAEDLSKSEHAAQVKAYWRVLHRYVRTELGDTDYAARLDVGLAVVRKTDPPRGSHALIEELFVLLKFREHDLDEDAAESLHEGRSERAMTIAERLEHQGSGA